MKIFALIIAVLNLSTIAICQELEAVKGRIIDSNNRPLPYATIRLKNISMGVVSNQDGDFQLPLKLHLLQDTLIVSYIGFTTRILPSSRLKPQDINIIVLKELPIQIPEIEIRSSQKGRLTGKKIVLAAINNIPVNYPVHPFAYVAYYRDYQIKENYYTNLNEAIVRVTDRGFNTNDQLHTRMELMQYKINKTFPIDTLSSMPYDNNEKKFIPQAKLGSFGGNELAILRVHDALRNYKNFSYSFVGIFSKNFVKNHVFQLSEIVGHDNLQLYAIEFKSNLAVSDDLHFGIGKIYIQRHNYRIHKMEYSMYDKSHEGKLIYNIKVEYNDNNGEMHLNYISFNNEFKMRNPDDFRVLDTGIRSNLSAFIILFSHPPDTLTALDKHNYKFTIRGKKVEIDTVMFSLSGKGKEVIAMIKHAKEHGVLADKKLAKEITADYFDIKDGRNRIVNKMTFIEATQYREIFVQKIEQEADSYEEVLGIDKFMPLSKAKITNNMHNFEDYWMNTPLKNGINQSLQK